MLPNDENQSIVLQNLCCVALCRGDWIDATFMCADSLKMQLN